jgi:DNA polymerase delta subunit 4
MPPTGRRSGQTSRPQQSTLSFGTQSRVTKPSSTSAADTKKIKDIEPLVSDVLPPAQTSATHAKPEQVPVVLVESSKPLIRKLVVREQDKVVKEEPLSEVDLRASKITNAGLKQYWKKEEDKRMSPRGW